MNKDKTKDGYVLVVTIVITFAITLTVVTLFCLVYRYANTASRDLENLRETVKNYVGYNK